MGVQNLDRETLREVFVYLYRCWIQKDCREVPNKLALSPGDGFLLSETFALYFNTQSVEESTRLELSSRVNTPILFVAPSFPSGVFGVSDLSKPARVGAPFDRLLSIARENLKWLESHKERGLSLREAYETEE